MDGEGPQYALVTRAGLNLVGLDGTHYVQHQAGERLNLKCAKLVKFGGGSVMVWGMFSAAGVEPLTQLHGKVNANVSQNLLWRHGSFSPNIFQSASNFYARQCFPLSHCKTGKAPSKLRTLK